MNNISLKYRIAATVFVLEAIMTTLVLTQTLSFSERASRDQFKVTEGVIVALLKQVAHNALFIDEYDEIQNYIGKVHEDPRVTHVVVMDAQQKVVASTNMLEVGVSDIVFNQRLDHTWQVVMVSNEMENLGQVAVEFSNAALTEITQQAQRLGLILAISGMTVIAVVGLVIGQLLTRRLAKLTLTVQRFPGYPRRG